MAVVPIEKLVFAVGEVETGHIKSIPQRYKTVNSIGAHGRYQVMRANIAPWTQKALGRAYTPAEFLASPQAQDKVVTAQLAAHQKKYNSWESAASIWFSGQPNPNSTASDGGNTVRQYVDKVKKFLGGGSVTPSGGSTQIGLGGDLAEGLMGPFTMMAEGIMSTGKSLMTIGELATFLLKLALPSTWVRIVCGVMGAAFLLFGLVVLGRESRGT